MEVDFIQSLAVNLCFGLGHLAEHGQTGLLYRFRQAAAGDDGLDVPQIPVLLVVHMAVMMRMFMSVLMPVMMRMPMFMSVLMPVMMRMSMSVVVLMPVMMRMFMSMVVAVMVMLFQNHIHACAVDPLAGVPADAQFEFMVEPEFGKLRT